MSSLVVEVVVEQLVTLWTVIDPIGTLPVFIAVTAGLSARQQRKIAVRSTLISLGILVGFIILGQIILEGLNISLVAFQIAGGMILFLFALSMIFGDSKPQSDLSAPRELSDVAVFPLAMPSLASPGAMLAVVLLTDNDRYSVAHQAMTAAVVALVLAAALLIMLLAAPLYRIMGMGGAAIVSRVMGMFLAAVATDNVLEAFQKLGVLPPI